MKGLLLMRWLVRLFCPPGGVVLDPTTDPGGGWKGLQKVKFAICSDFLR